MSMPSHADLGPELNSHRVLGTAAAAQFCGYSVPHWRRLYAAKRAPAPVRINGGKLGFKVADLIAFNSKREGA